VIKFIHSADIHLDSPMRMLSKYEGAPVEEVQGATRRALENLVDLAVNEKTDFVLICGDLYDGDWRDYQTGLFFVSQMAKLHDVGISVYIVAGNHDAANRMTRRLPLPKNVRLLSPDEPQTIEIDNIGVVVHGQSFISQAIYSDLSEKYPDAIPGMYNIGMLHTCANSRPGHDPYAPCTIRGLSLKGYDYWALGHIHKRETLLEDPFVIFPGNPQGRHIGETGPKGCMLVTVDEKGLCSPEFRPLEKVRWEICEIDLPDTTSESALFERILEGLARVCGTTELPLIVRLKLRRESPGYGSIAPEMERIANDIRSESIVLFGGRVWIEKIVLENAVPAALRMQTAAGPVSELLDLVRELASDQAYMERAGDSLRELWGRLPKEVRDSDDAISPDDPHRTGELIEEIQADLLRRFKGLQQDSK
jgi:DNA repair exonuclease SbcCD nuclease subunit